MRESLAMNRRIFGSEDPVIAESLNYMGSGLRLKENYAEAKTVLREALAMNRKLLG